MTQRNRFSEYICTQILQVNISEGLLRTCIWLSISCYSKRPQIISSCCLKLRTFEHLFALSDQMIPIAQRSITSPAVLENKCLHIGLTLSRPPISHITNVISRYRTSSTLKPALQHKSFNSKFCLENKKIQKDVRVISQQL